MLIDKAHEGQEVALCGLLAQTVKGYFQTQKHRKEFEKWYLDTYGKQYEWRKSA